MIYYGTGVLARMIGLYPAANSAVMLAFASSAVGFYLAARLFGVARLWACALAVVFALSPYAFSRQLHHLQVLYVWHIPLCILAIHRLWELPPGKILSRTVLFSALLGVISATLHPYYTNMFLQFVCIVCGLHFLRGNKSGTFGSAVVVFATLGMFFVLCANVLWNRIVYGPNTRALERAFQWLELSALKPLDMLLPTVNHHFSAFADLAKKYLSGVAIPGEMPQGSYLGIVALACAGWLGFVSLRGLILRSASRLPRECWMILWMVLYAVVGGLNCLGGVGGLLIFRSSNRYSIFILAIALLWAGRSISLARLPQALAPFAVLGVVGVALWDQIPAKRESMDSAFPLPPIRLADDARRIKQVVDSDQAFVAALEASVPPGTMVFQLPVMEYPESPIRGVGSYEHFRPYLYSRSLHFSYGTCKGREREDWQKKILEQPIPKIVADLERLGFGAIYVHRGGFEDLGEALRTALAAAGRDRVIESQLKDLYVVLLSPAAVPESPDTL
jgi:phosphoglycerol transferase